MNILKIMNDKEIQPNTFLSKKVFDRIEKDDIEPLSKFRLRLQNDGFWILWILSLLIGATAVAGTLFVFLHADWRFYNAIYDSFFSFLNDTLPYMWMLTLLVFLLLAYQNIRHTKYGYRYPLSAVIALSGVLSVVIGVCLYVFGLGQIIDQDVGGHIPLYTPTVTNQELKWNQPDRGLIAGTVTYISPDFSTFTVSAYDGKEWNVNGDDLLHIDHLILSEYTDVRIVGLPIDPSDAQESASSTNEFHACLILPWMQKVDQYENERNIKKERSKECKGVRPYQLLQELQDEAN